MNGISLMGIIHGGVRVLNDGKGEGEKEANTVPFQP
jgi:hypothetical protein